MYLCAEFDCSVVYKKHDNMGNFFKSLFLSKPNRDLQDETGDSNNKENDFDVLKYDGVRAQRMGKLVYAEKCFRAAIELKEDFQTLSYLASVEVSQGKLDEALAVLDRMVELQSENIAVRLNRVNLLFMLGKIDEIVSDCQQIIGQDETNAVAYYQMARAKKEKSDLLGAIADLTRSVSLKEDFVEAYQLRAEVLLLMGQLSEALDDVEKVNALAPEEESAPLLKGRIFETMQDLAAAEKEYRKVLELNPFNREAALSLGNLLIASEKADDAIALYDEVIDLMPEFAKAYAERGRAKNLKGDKEGAFSDLKKSIELNPESDEAKLMNGEHSNFDNLYKGGIY